jgi:hypothetical protein
MRRDNTRRNTARRGRGTVANSLSAEARRLLKGLARQGAAASHGEGETLTISAPGRHGVSVSHGRVAPAAAKALVDAGLAAWTGAGGDARLVATPEGMARLRREAADPDVAYLAQHRALERAEAETEQGTAVVWRDADESPLAWLARRRDASGKPLIGVAALAAGERLRRDLTLARTLPRITANWTAPIAAGTRTGAGGPELMLDAVLTARAKVDAALAAVGPALAGLLLDVCGFLKGLEEVERERGWPARSAKVVLGVALDRLAAHYGLAEEARGPDAGKGLRVWAQDGWRPSLS